MYKTDPILVEKCRILRRKGFTLGEVVKAVKLPKTTIYDHVYDISLSPELKEKIKKEAIKRITQFSRERKGKCMFGRVVPKPRGWTKELISLVTHFMFDGEIRTHCCVYHNRNKSLIEKVRSSMKKIFNLKPHEWFNEGTGVHRVSYHYVELADYIRKKAERLKDYIKTAFLSEKKIFLKAFYDDEGSVHFEKKLARGFQHNLEILKLVQKLLKDFDIESKIDEKYKEIVISRKSNLVKFRDKINFLKGVYINPDRKNSIWKKKLEKREILDYTINSYQN